MTNTAEAPKALHYSQGKPALDQLPPELLFEWAQVFSYGEQKYARDNWKSGTDWHQFIGSAFRHFMNWLAGQDYDPESGLPELAMVMWNIGCLRYYQIHGLGNDDRGANPREAGWQIPQYKSPPPAQKPVETTPEPETGFGTLGDILRNAFPIPGRRPSWNWHTAPETGNPVPTRVLECPSYLLLDGRFWDCQLTYGHDGDCVFQTDGAEDPAYRRCPDCKQILHNGACVKGEAA